MKGCVKVTYDQVCLFDDQGKVIGHTQIIRSDYDEDSPRSGQQKISIKKKEVFLAEGFHITLGKKVVQVFLNFYYFINNENS